MLDTLYLHILALMAQCGFVAKAIQNEPSDSDLETLLSNFLLTFDDLINLCHNPDEDGTLCDFVLENRLEDFIGSIEEWREIFEEYIGIEREMLLNTNHIVSVANECLECINNNDCFTN